MAERRAPRGHWANVASATRAQSFRTHEVGVAVLDSVRFGKRGDRVQPRIALEEVEPPRVLAIMTGTESTGLARSGSGSSSVSESPGRITAQHAVTTKARRMISH